MNKLKIKSFGTDCQGIELKGDPRSPEPIHARIVFPGGDLEVVRCTGETPSYWVHVRINHPESGQYVPGETLCGKISDARLDIIGEHASQVDHGDFENPGLYHLAVKVEPRA